MSLSLASKIKLSSGHAMPLLGFGVYQNYDAEPCVLEAFKVGYRHVDSAQVYRNEDQVGLAIEKSGLKRGELFITTKCVSKNHGYQSTLEGVKESLRKFFPSEPPNAETASDKYIDLFLIHDPMSGQERRLETYKALQECKDAGQIRSVGVSNYGVNHLEEIKAAGYATPSVNQIELHPLCQQKPIVNYCRANSIVVQAYCPIIRGKMDNPVIQGIASKYNKDPAQILLRWSLQNGFVPLPKSATPERIQSNTHLYDFSLNTDDMAQLDGLDRGKEGSISWNPVDFP